MNVEVPDRPGCSCNQQLADAVAEAVVQRLRPILEAAQAPAEPGGAG